jgi:hypothetical protein
LSGLCTRSSSMSPTYSAPETLRACWPNIQMWRGMLGKVEPNSHAADASPPYRALRTWAHLQT